MALTRRQFLKTAGAAAAAGTFGINMEPVKAYAQPLRIERAKETTTVCPYCGVGCSIIVHTVRDDVVYTEGDSNSPVNAGTLCSKGAALYQLHKNERRLKYPMYRAPGATEWERVSWDWALDEIARRVKATRDATFTEKNAKGQAVNRTLGIASVGSAALDNEECYAYQKLLRSWGLTYIEHQARI